MGFACQTACSFVQWQLLLPWPLLLKRTKHIPNVEIYLSNRIQKRRPTLYLLFLQLSPKATKRPKPCQCSRLGRRQETFSSLLQNLSSPMGTKIGSSKQGVLPPDRASCRTMDGKLWWRMKDWRRHVQKSQPFLVYVCIYMYSVEVGIYILNAWWRCKQIICV